MKRLKKELSQYEKDMKAYIMAKIKNRFNDIKFHRCRKCCADSVKIFEHISSINCFLYANFEVNEDYLTLKFDSQVDSTGKIGLYSFNYCLKKKKCDGIPYEPAEHIQAQKIIAYRKEIINIFTNLCHKMYYTDELKLLQKQYYTFLLSSRKTFTRDIRNIISQKILFFKN